MQNRTRIIAVSFVTIALVSCGGSGKDEKSAVNEKKAELEKLKSEQKSTTDKIAKLEEEIAKLDPASAKQEKTKLVALTPLEKGNFAHYIDLQGSVQAENISYVTPRGAGGQVKAIYVNQGDYVKKGQLLMKLDDAIQKKQIDQLQTQLAYAEDLYKRQKNLWDQNIGTEVQLINAKNNVDQVKKQIALAEEQLGFNNVYAEMSGVADQVNIKVGESFSPATAALYGIEIVNTNDLKVVVKVPENYLSKVGVGSIMEISLPESDKKLTAKITVSGKIIDPVSRAFYVEAKIPGGSLKPNQIAMVRIQDYASKDVITIPVNTLQTDEQGKYVLVAATENGRQIARKKRVEIGELYGDSLEVKGGLEAGDQLITEGFQGLYEGQPITTVAR